MSPMARPSQARRCPSGESDGAVAVACGRGRARAGRSTVSAGGSVVSREIRNASPGAGISKPAVARGASDRGSLLQGEFASPNVACGASGWDPLVQGEIANLSVARGGSG